MQGAKKSNLCSRVEDEIEVKKYSERREREREREEREKRREGIGN